MLIGTWRMVEANGQRLPEGAGPLFAFNADGTCVNDKGGGRVYRADFEYDEAAKVIRIKEGDEIVFQMSVQELGEARLVAKMGPEVCSFERAEGVEAGAAREAPPASQPPTIYQLSLSTSQCEATATLNGFPILQSRIDKDGMASQPVNPLLIGAGNRLLIEVTGKGADARLEGSLEVVAAGDVVEVGGAGDISLPDGDPPQTIAHVFDSPIAPFANVLAQARPATAAEAVDFALHLRDALRGRDEGTLAGLFQPVVALLAEAFGQTQETMRGQLAGLFEMAFGSDLAFEGTDVEAVPYCDGRVWELRRTDGRQLIFSGPDADGSTSHLAVYAANLGDGFRVVR